MKLSKGLASSMLHISFLVVLIRPVARIFAGVGVRMSASGGSGGIPPGKFEKNGLSGAAFRAF